MIKFDVCAFLEEQFGINMNEQQKQGVLEISDNTLLLAVPGSGKTTVMVARIANLILNHHVSPRSILTLTFSRESAMDMAARYQTLFGNQNNHLPKFSTIHSFCYSVLRLYKDRYGRQMPQLLETAQRNQILIEINQTVNNSFLGDDGLEELQNLIGYIKNTCATKTQITKIKTDIENLSQIHELYEQFKKENSLMDYDDMLQHTLVILQKCKEITDYYQRMYQYIHVDEAQDTSLLQHKIIKKLASKSKIFMVGDEDQSIYSFRGAYPDELLKFEQNYKDAKLLKLEQNYRSGSDIVEKANQFIKINNNRYVKEMFTDNDKAGAIEKVYLNDYREQFSALVKAVKSIPADMTIGVIYRNNESGLLLSKALLDDDMSFYIKEHKISLFKSGIIKPVIAFMEFVDSPSNIKLFEQLYKRFKISKASFDIIKSVYRKYPTIMDCVLNESRMEQGEANFAVVVKDVLRQVRGKSPSQIIEAFEKQLGYDGFLRWRIESGYSAPNILQKLHIFKELSKEYSAADDFIKAMSGFEERISRFSNKENSRITLTTVHSAKGLEFDVVFLIDMVDGVLPTTAAIESSEKGEEADIESEARLFYVAVTRARERLVIYHANSMYGQQATQSRFITHLLKSGKMTSMRTAIKRSIPKVQMDLAPYTQKKMVHNFFGEGIVLRIDSEVALVRFAEHGNKEINLRYCLEKKLIREIT